MSESDFSTQDDEPDDVVKNLDWETKRVLYTAGRARKKKNGRWVTVSRDDIEKARILDERIKAAKEGNKGSKSEYDTGRSRRRSPRPQQRGRSPSSYRPRSPSEQPERPQRPHRNRQDPFRENDDPNGVVRNEGGNDPRQDRGTERYPRARQPSIPPPTERQLQSRFPGVHLSQYGPPQFGPSNQFPPGAEVGEFYTGDSTPPPHGRRNTGPQEQRPTETGGRNDPVTQRAPSNTRSRSRAFVRTGHGNAAPESTPLPAPAPAAPLPPVVPYGGVQPETAPPRSQSKASVRTTGSQHGKGKNVVPESAPPPVPAQVGKDAGEPVSVEREPPRAPSNAPSHKSKHEHEDKKGKARASPPPPPPPGERGEDNGKSRKAPSREVSRESIRTTVPDYKNEVPDSTPLPVPVPAPAPVTAAPSLPVVPGDSGVELKTAPSKAASVWSTHSKQDKGENLVPESAPPAQAQGGKDASDTASVDEEPDESKGERGPQSVTGVKEPDSKQPSRASSKTPSHRSVHKVGHKDNKDEAPASPRFEKSKSRRENLAKELAQIRSQSQISIRTDPGITSTPNNKKAKKKRSYYYVM